MIIQYILLALIIGAAIFFLARRVYRSFSSKKGCEGCSCSALENLDKTE